MPYPPRYRPSTDFGLAEQQGKPVHGGRLATELANVGETLAQVIQFLRAGMTPDRRWQPSGALAQKLADREQIIGTAGMTDLPVPGPDDADPIRDFVRVFVNGSLRRPDRVVLHAQTVELLDPLTGGEQVVVELFTDYRAFETRLASSAADAGATLVGLRDLLGQYVSDDVEGALEEIGLKWTQLLEALGDISKFALITGKRPWEDDQSMGGHRLFNVADGIDPQDAATVAQLQSLQDLFGQLGDVFLALAGGIMQGPISMGGNLIVEMQNGTEPHHAINLGQLNAAIAGVASKFMPRSGGTFTGPVEHDGSPLSGVGAPVEDTDAVNLESLDAAIAAVLGEVEGMIATLEGDGFPRSAQFDLAGLGSPVGGLGNGGIFHFTSFETNAPQTLNAPTRVHASEGATIQHEIVSNSDFELFVDGDLNITLGGSIVSTGEVTLRATGDIMIAGGAISMQGRAVRLLAGGEVDCGRELRAEIIDVSSGGDATFGEDVVARNTSTENHLQGEAFNTYTVSGNTLDNGAGGGAGALGGRGGGGPSVPLSGVYSEGGPPSVWRLSRYAGIHPSARELGGRGGESPTGALTPAGGFLRMVVAGDLTIASGKLLRADGTNATSVSSGTASGGGGGGCVLLFVKGEPQNIDASATGGDGAASGTKRRRSGAGGGGRVLLVSVQAPAPAMVASAERGTRLGTTDTPEAQDGTVEQFLITEEEFDRLRRASAFRGDPQ